MSSKKQDKSIPAQRDEVERYAKANGYHIIRWTPYVDEGISGSESDARPGFKQLISDASATGDFEAILVWDQDRLSRFDPMEANYYWFQLREAGVRVVSVTQGELDWESLGGWLTASVTQHGKAQYLKDLSRNVLRGRLKKAKAGKWACARVPYGYAIDEDSNIILGDGEAVETIKWIFKAYSRNESSLHDIAHELNAQGILSPGGKIWSTRNIQYIVNREDYSTGRIAQFREAKGKFYAVNGDDIVERKKNDAATINDNCHYVKCPQIVNKRLWNQCRTVMAKRRKQTTPRSSAGSKSVLNGLLICGHCGKPMYATTSPRREKSEPGGVRYICSSYMRNGTRVCNRNGIREKALLDMLVEQICDKVLAPNELERLRAEVARQLEAKAEKPDAGRINRLRKNLNRIDEEIRAAARELKRTPDDLYDLAVDDLRELRTERANVASRIEATEIDSKPRSSAATESLERTVKRLHGLRENLTSGNRAVVRRCIREIVQNVELWFTHKKCQRTLAKFEKGLIRFNSAELNKSANQRH